MRNILKLKEPRSLTEHKKRAYADYDNYSHKDDVRQKLYEEQKGLCCYCMCRIKPDQTHMKIEHWHCQESYPKEQLDYRNMLGVCKGGEGKPKKIQHCDTRKGNSDLSFNPADPRYDVEAMFRFLGDGRIQATDPVKDREINDILNLNLSWIVQNRKAVLDAFKERLGKLGRHFDPEKEISKWDGSASSVLPEYSQVVVYYLKKKRQRQV